jgi:hypothetical protein
VLTDRRSRSNRARRRAPMEPCSLINPPLITSVQIHLVFSEDTPPSPTFHSPALASGSFLGAAQRRLQGRADHRIRPALDGHIPR